MCMEAMIERMYMYSIIYDIMSDGEYGLVCIVVTNGQIVYKVETYKYVGVTILQNRRRIP